jgi:hypothetical protein
MRKLLLGFFLCCTLAAVAGPKARSIKGVVFGADQETLAGARVEIKGTDIVVYSDLDGAFSIDDLKPGEYQLVITMVSYEEFELEDVALGEPSSAALKVNLQAR